MPSDKGDRARLVRLRPALRLRSTIVAAIRRFFEERGSLEVETPTLVASPGTDPNLAPVQAGDGYLITSPELHMKRLVAAGYDRVHQLCRCYRQGESGALHNPEFTMLEWYWAGASYMDLADELEALVEVLARQVRGGPALEERGLDLSRPWQRLTVSDAFERYAGWRPGPDPDPDRFFFDLVDKVERHLGRGRPTFLCEYPASQAVLSRLHPDDPGVALRFELYVDGVELVNAFDELTDATEQRRRFERDNEERRRRGLPELPIDEAFLDALETMPPTSGAAMGIDRLVMLLAGAETIADVMAFIQRSV